MSSFKIKKINQGTLTQMVYNSIKESIINGDIPAGTRLTENILSEQLNVSSTPVREALRELASEGLIQIIPYRGAIVQKFSREQLEEIYHCREALELKALELAMKNIEHEDIAYLKKLLDESGQTDDHTSYVEINSNIHNFIFEKANNQTLKNLMKQIQEVIMHNRAFTSYSDKRKSEVYEEHNNIISAMENKDVENAKKFMKIHIEKGYNYIREELGEK